MILGKINEVLFKRMESDKELNELPLEKLVKLQEQYADKCKISGEIYTGRSLAKIKFPSTDETISVEY